MPAKKEAIALQKDICNQEQWDDIMSLEGLWVVDVYQKWCGPCAAVISLFRRLKNEIGDDLLKFATAECDSIENLEKYRGHCEPCFLFYGTGQLVDVVRGANGPALHKALKIQLAAEHQVLEEGAERKVIKDPLMAAMEAKEQAAAEAEAADKRKQDEEAQKPVPKEVTVVLVKPDAVKEGKVEEIIQKLEENGLEVLAQEEKTLTEDEAREFYKEHEEEDHFDTLVEFMSSGPSHILVLTKGDTGEGVVHDVRTLLGPTDVEIAREEAPDSLRALFGTDKTMNALHGADSAERAARELTFFFPNFAVPIVPGTGPPPQVEKTLALIRPDALKENKEAIMEKIKASGFEVCLQKEIQLTEEQAKEFYKQQEGQPHFDELIGHMTSGPVLALGLAREKAIQNWRNMLGPKEVDVAKQEAPDSLRAQFSLPDSSINCVHGSDSVESAQKELNYFFPTEHTLAVIKPDAAQEHKDAIIERIHEAGFNIACQKNVELDRELAEQLYKEHEGKEFFDSLLDHMTSGPSMIMVLSREDAVQGWRTVMGPTDPELAKEQAPESLRALLGKDVLQNAIHGSSNPNSAKEKIGRFFPEVSIDSDGSIMEMGEPSAETPPEGTAQDQQEMGSEDKDEGEVAGEDGEEQAPAEPKDDNPQDGKEEQAGGEEAEEESPGGGEGEAEGPEEGARGEAEGPGAADHDEPPAEESKEEQTADKAASPVEAQEAEPSQEIEDQTPEEADERVEVTEPGTDEGGDTQEAEEPGPEGEQQQEEQPPADQSEGDAEAGEGDKPEEGATDQAPAPEDTPSAAEDTPQTEDAPPAAEDTPPATEDTPPATDDTPPAAEDTPPAAEDTPPAAEDTPPAAEDTPPAAEDTPNGEEQQASDDKPAEDQQTEDDKPAEGAAEPEPEPAPAEEQQGEQAQAEEPAPEGGGDEKEEPAPEGGEGQAEEPAPEGGEEKKEEPPAE